MTTPKPTLSDHVIYAVLIIGVLLLIALVVKVWSSYDERYQAYLLVSEEIESKWGGRGVMSYSNEEATRVTKDPGPPIKYVVSIYLINSDGSTRPCFGSAVKDPVTGKIRLESATC